jgi:hypothetical protein
MGPAFMATFLATGSILVVIVAQALFDLRSMALIPVLVFHVHQEMGSGAPKRETVVAEPIVERSGHTCAA